MFSGGRFDGVLPRDSKGRVFLDLEGTLFAKLLDFLASPSNEAGSGHEHLVIPGNDNLPILACQCVHPAALAFGQCNRFPQ